MSNMSHSNALQNYIDAWNAVFKKPVDASKFADFINDSDVCSLIGLTDNHPKNMLTHCVGKNGNTLYTLKTSADEYWHVYHNDKEIFSDAKFIDAKVYGNVVYVQRECDGRWNGINNNGDLIWNNWMLSVKKIITGDVLVCKEAGNFFLANEDGIPIDIGIDDGTEEDKDDGNESHWDTYKVEPVRNGNIPYWDTYKEEPVREEHDNIGEEFPRNKESAENAISDNEDNTIGTCESKLGQSNAHPINDEYFNDLIKEKLKHFYTKKLPDIKQEIIETANDIVNMFCEDIFQGICNELTGDNEVYWEIENSNCVAIPDDEGNNSGGTPARDVVSDEEVTKPQPVKNGDTIKETKSIPDDEDDNFGGTSARDVVHDAEGTKPQPVKNRDTIKKTKHDSFWDEALREVMKRAIRLDIDDILDGKYKSPEWNQITAMPEWNQTTTRLTN